MDRVLERLKGLKDEESRYAYTDTVTNAFLTGQIKALREAREFTQEQLATLVGTRQSGISRWLNTGFATCKVETLRKFARAYGVRLRISFEEFGSLPDDLSKFDEPHLVPCAFEDDPLLFPKDPDTSKQQMLTTYDVNGSLAGPPIQPSMPSGALASTHAGAAGVPIVNPQRKQASPVVSIDSMGGRKNCLRKKPNRHHSRITGRLA